MNIYADGTFDLFHSGHICFFEKIKKDNPNCNLIIGVISDLNVKSYKRLPIISLKDRVKLLENIKIIDKVISDCPFKNITKEFIISHNISKVYYAGENNNWKEHYSVPIKMGIMNYIPYNFSNLSTTSIIKKVNDNDNDKSYVLNSKVYVRKDKIKNFTSCAKINLKKDELIEKGLVRKLSDNQNKNFDGMNNPYVFTWSDNNPNYTWAFGSGCSTFYNTSLTPNTYIKRNFDSDSFEIYALRDIQKDEELTHTYKSLAWRSCFKDLNQFLKKE